MSVFSIPIPKIRRRKLKVPTPGAAPGTLVVSSDLSKPTLFRFIFNHHNYEFTEMETSDLDKALIPMPGSTLWLDIRGLGDSNLIKQVGERLGLHPLILEDIIHVHQRPKVEEFDDYLYVVLRAIRLLDEKKIDNEQLSFVLKEGILVTFQERIGDGFEPVRRRLREGKGFIRKGNADYLLYALIDMTIDNYYPVLELYGDTMEQLDEEVRENPHPELSRAVHSMRRELRQFRRAVWPLRDVTGALSRNDYSLVAENVRVALRDCYDHVVQVSDFVEGSRERASDLADLYMTMVSERTNQVMKVLTIIATVFIPLTFLCGLYGMNFDPEASRFNMPELKWKYGYLAFWGATVVILVSMLWFFRRKGWIGRKGKTSD